MSQLSLTLLLLAVAAAAIGYGGFADATLGEGKVLAQILSVVLVVAAAFFSVVPAARDRPSAVER